MNINKLIAGAMTASLGLIAYGSVPEVSNVTMSQAGWGRLVTVNYTLSAPAVITLDVQTNANTSASENDSGWTSIGGVAVSNARGDVWKKVEAGNRTISWRPDQSWPGHDIANGGARAVVTAWALNNTPDYMVVDISAGAKPNTQRYFPSVDHLPGSLASQTGAITNNPAYKTTMIVMRKIMAKDVIWTMGSTSAETQRCGNNGSGTLTNEDTHQVALTNNYYIGVFLVTQGQWSLIHDVNKFPSNFTNVNGRIMRPVENVCFNEIRMAANSTSAAEGAQEWPGAPYEGSFLNLLRVKTGIDFDLPSEAQWEFAARAGNGDTKWGDGSSIKNNSNDENLDKLGRHYKNNGESSGDRNSGPEYGTAVVGSYKPNNWGIYDMHGNVWEWCLDCFIDNIVDFEHNLEGPVVLAENATHRVVRGGAWSYYAHECRPARRFRVAPSLTSGGGQIGFRLACKAGLD